MDKNAKGVIVTGYLEFEQKNKSTRARIGFCYFKANQNKHAIRFGKEIFDLNNSEKQDSVSNSNLERSIS